MSQPSKAVERLARIICAAHSPPHNDPDEMVSALRPTKSGHGQQFYEVPAWTRHIKVAEAVDRETRTGELVACLENMIEDAGGDNADSVAVREARALLATLRSDK